jgi:hypothetical protein
MKSVGFEPLIPESKRPQYHLLDRTATGIDTIVLLNTRKSYLGNRRGEKRFLQNIDNFFSTLKEKKAGFYWEEVAAGKNI